VYKGEKTGKGDQSGKRVIIREGGNITLSVEMER